MVALDEALQVGKPAIFTTDQGGQITSCSFTGTLEEAGMATSMDGRGGAFDNIFAAQRWRTVKYEDSYLKRYGRV